MAEINLSHKETVSLLIKIRDFINKSGDDLVLERPANYEFWFNGYKIEQNYKGRLLTVSSQHTVTILPNNSEFEILLGQIQELLEQTYNRKYETRKKTFLNDFGIG